MTETTESAPTAGVEGAVVPAGPPKRWYVVHAYSGMEKSVARHLQERIDRSGLQPHFGRILVPTEEVVEIKGGKKSISERRLYSGYVLVEMEMADIAWHLVKTTGVVFLFVALMAVFLFAVDHAIEYGLYDLLLGWKR